MHTILKNQEGHVWRISEKMFRATGHSDGGAEKGREPSVPLAALTNLYMVFIKMSLDERKSFPQLKVTVLSIKLTQHKSCNFALHTKATLTEPLLSLAP